MSSCNPKSSLRNIFGPPLALTMMLSSNIALANNETITVDLASTGVPAGTYSVGFLHTYPKDDFVNNPVAKSWFQAVNPKNWRTWGYPAPLQTNYEAFTNYNGMKALGVQDIQLSCSDYYVFYQHTGGINQFIADCKELATKAKNEGKTFQWDIINEGNVGGAAWMDWWVEGAKAVRSVLPNATLIGPSHVNNLGIDFGTFLDKAYAGGVYPDILAYHEFVGPGQLENSVNWFKTYPVQRGYPARPVIVSEFWPTEKDTNFPISPATPIAYYAAAQRAGVKMNYAVNYPRQPSLNHLLSYTDINNFSTYYRNELYWVHELFTNTISGTMRSTVSSNKSVVDGLSAVNSTQGQARVLIGSPYASSPGNVKLTLKNLNATPYLKNGSTVKIEVRKLPYVGGPSNGFTYGYFLTGTVVNESVTFDISLANHEAAYVLVNTPRSGDILLSQGRPAVASDSATAAYPASKAVDGQTGNEDGWASNAASTAHWWQVDLGSSKTIKRIEIADRPGYDQPSTRRNFEVWASNNANSSDKVVLGSIGSTGAFRDGGAWILNVNSATKYRYVSIVKTAPEYMYLNEVSVYGQN
jgi:F5/8 type C domain